MGAVTGIMLIRLTHLTPMMIPIRVKETTP